MTVPLAIIFKTNLTYDFGTPKKAAQLQYLVGNALHFVLSDLRAGGT